MLFKVNDVSSRIHMAKYSSDAFTVHIDLEQRNTLSPELLDFALAYAIRKSQLKEGVHLNGLNQVLASADGINLLRKNISIIKNDEKILIQVSKEICLKVNTDKTKYMNMT
jgi:hypothetical protein